MSYFLTGFWPVAVTAIAAAVVFWLGIRNIRYARIVEDIPTSKVRSAAQGYTELAGVVATSNDNLGLISPITGRKVCWYRFKVEKRVKNGWRAEEKGQSDAPILLDDGTGQCRIDPRGASIDAPRRRVWHNNLSGVIHPSARSSGGVLGLFEADRRFVEESIVDGDPIYALGWFRTTSAAAQHDQSVEGSEKALLNEWRHNQPRMRSLFDRNKDGHIDGNEWEAVRRVAKLQANRQAPAASSFDDIHQMIKPPDRAYPFMISGKDELGFARGRRAWGVAGLIAFVVLAVLSVWFWNRLP